MKAIHCAVVGKGFTIFSVQMKADETVEDLRKIIKAEMEFSVAAPKLQLFLAKKNGRWLKLTDKDLALVVNGKTPRWIDTKAVLHPFCWIDYYSLAFPNSEDLTAADINDIHVLVKDPSLKEECGYFVLLFFKLIIVIVLIVVTPNFTTKVGDILQSMGIVKIDCSKCPKWW